MFFILLVKQLQNESTLFSIQSYMWYDWMLIIITITIIIIIIIIIINI